VGRRKESLILKDTLEKKVNEKYYLNEEYHKRYKESLNNQKLQNKIPQTGDMVIKGTTHQ
jgi:hypothetical protein